MWPGSRTSLRKSYFQKFNLPFAGHFDLAWESNLELIHRFAIQAILLSSVEDF